MDVRQATETGSQAGLREGHVEVLVDQPHLPDPVVGGCGSVRIDQS